MAVIIAPIRLCVRLWRHSMSKLMLYHIFDIAGRQAAGRISEINVLRSVMLVPENILNLKASFFSLPIARIEYKSNYSIPRPFYEFQSNNDDLHPRGNSTSFVVNLT